MSADLDVMRAKIRVGGDGIAEALALSSAGVSAGQCERALLARDARGAGAAPSTAWRAGATRLTGGFYGPGRPAIPDALTRAAAYARNMPVTTESDRRQRSASALAEHFPRSKRGSLPRVRSTDTPRHPRAVAGPSPPATAAAPGTEPPFLWQGYGATYDLLHLT
jgi:hypothetical protein